MKLANSLSRTLALALLVPALNVTASELESALKGALHGTQLGHVDWFKPALELFDPTLDLFSHTFAVHPAQIVEKEKGRSTLAGKLSRSAGPARQNDVIAYRITRETGVVKEITWQVNGGEWAPLSEPITRALNEFSKGLPMTLERRREVESALERAVDKTWQRAAEFLIAHIALRDC